MDEYPECKRIKLEHSYARETGQVVVKVEDPLQISPEDLENIKKEPEEQEETVAIKQEPGAEEEKCESEHGHDEKSLMDMVGSEPCESAESDFFANLGLINSDVGAANNGPSVDADVVPKVVFQEMQKMYEKAMADVTSLTKKLTTEKQKKASQSVRNANNKKILKNDIKRLKEELNSSKFKEESLKRAMGSRAQSESEMKNTIVTLRTQVDKLMTENKTFNGQLASLKQTVRNKEINLKTLKNAMEQRSKILDLKRKEEESLIKLKQLCDIKESQRKKLEKKCVHLSQNLVKTNTKLTSQRSELEKLRLDMDIMDRSIIDSVKARHVLREQLTVIDKDFMEYRQNSPLKLRLNEMQSLLNKSSRSLEETQKQLEVEKNNVSLLKKERLQLVNEHKARCKELENQANFLRSTITMLKKSYRERADEYRTAAAESKKYSEELARCKSELKSVKTDMQKKVEEAEARQCQYCGF